MQSREDVRNIAIVAHVDHGKTTLVDALLKQAGSFRKGEVLQECALDSNELERERGITILSKCTAITYKSVRINIVDTPGHADFGGEVERVLRMVDSVLLLVDAFEGPLPQTRFVTRKALELGLKPILVVNKIDRPGCNPHGTVDAVFDLFCNLGASEAQLDFPVIFASGRNGYAVMDPSDTPQDLSPLMDMILAKVPAPLGDLDKSFCMQVATLEHDDYLGYVAVGRVLSGKVNRGERLLLIHKDGHREEFRVNKILTFQGLRRFEVEKALGGDIIAITGMEELNVGETITSIESPLELPPLSVDEPTIRMQFIVNNGPFVGTEGKLVTSRNLRDRLLKEVKSNVALRVEESEQTDVFQVSGRGELHLAVLIETMRREGYEFCVSQPQVVVKENDKGDKEEPYEDVWIEVEEGHVGVVIDKLGKRLGRLQDMGPVGGGRTKLEFTIPSRGLMGYRSEFLTDTRGTGIINQSFRGYGPYVGSLKSRQNGVLIAMEPGETNTYGLFYLQERGSLFLGPGEKIYGGQIVGLHSRDNDLVVNPCKAKKLTNIRTTAADEKMFLTPPQVFSLEAALEFINEDELVEVTPKAIRLRKRVLDHNARKRSEKEA